MSKHRRFGELGVEYARGRREKRSMRYRLWRRTREVCSAIEKYADGPPSEIVDLGTADGRMLEAIHAKHPRARCVGVESNEGLANLARTEHQDLQIVLGDIRRLPFGDGSFDVAVAAAVIEHVDEPEEVLGEIRRVLRGGGIVVLTTPHPFWEAVARAVGHLPGEQHNRVMGLEQLSGAVRECGLEVIGADRFMLSPVGMPLEFVAERLVRALGLSFLMANQILVARKPAPAERIRRAPAGSAESE